MNWTTPAHFDCTLFGYLRPRVGETRTGLPNEQHLTDCLLSALVVGPLGLHSSSSLRLEVVAIIKRNTRPVEF